MNDIHYITVGFVILSKYEGTGEVNVDRARNLYAGPEDLDEEEYLEEDRTNLQANYWHYAEQICRWGYSL